MLTLISKILDNGVKVFIKELAMLTTQNSVTWAPIPLVGISESSTDTRMVACHFYSGVHTCTAVSLAVSDKELTLVIKDTTNEFKYEFSEHRGVLHWLDSELFGSLLIAIYNQSPRSADHLGLNK